MQWDASPNGGFTTGTPWIMVNPNYTAINAAAQTEDPDSVFSYYRKLIALRRNSQWSEVIVYGHYALLAPEDEAVFAYVRELDGWWLLVICNLSPEKRRFQVPEEIRWDRTELLISNRGERDLSRTLDLLPWEAVVWEIL